MKKALLFLVIIALSNVSFGQYKFQISNQGLKMPTANGGLTMHYDSQNIAFLARDFNPHQGINIFPSGQLLFQHNNNGQYAVSTSVKSYTNDSKHWLVSRVSDDFATFFVTGDGRIRASGPALILSNDSTIPSNEILDPITALLGLKTYSGNAANPIVGLKYLELNQNIPAATNTYQGKNYINYDAIIPYLVAAIKDQQKQIINLNTIINKVNNPLGINQTINNSVFDNNQSLLNNENTQTSISTSGNMSIRGSELFQNSPNPFHQSTTIKYILPELTNSAQILILDLQGSLKKSYLLSNKPGSGDLKVHALELKPGMYLYSLVVNGLEVATKRMIITQ